MVGWKGRRCVLLESAHQSVHMVSSKIKNRSTFERHSWDFSADHSLPWGMLSLGFILLLLASVSSQPHSKNVAKPVFTMTLVRTKFRYADYFSKCACLRYKQNASGCWCIDTSTCHRFVNLSHTHLDAPQRCLLLFSATRGRVLERFNPFLQSWHDVWSGLGFCVSITFRLYKKLFILKIRFLQKSSHRRWKFPHLYLDRQPFYSLQLTVSLTKYFCCTWTKVY